jgi:hypothetical protein
MDNDYAALGAEALLMKWNFMQFLAYAATCKRHNRHEWMQGLVDEINDILEFLDDEDRVMLVGNDIRTVRNK